MVVLGAAREKSFHLWADTGGARSGQLERECLCHHVIVAGITWPGVGQMCCGNRLLRAWHVEGGGVQRCLWLDKLDMPAQCTV